MGREGNTLRKGNETGICHEKSQHVFQDHSMIFPTNYLAGTSKRNPTATKLQHKKLNSSYKNN